MSMLNTTVVVDKAKLVDQQWQSVKHEINRSNTTAYKLQTADIYIKQAANESVFAHALNSALSDYLDITSKNAASNQSRLSSKIGIDDEGLRIDRIRGNILNSISKSLSELANSGANPKQLHDARQQAILGVESGFSKASEELSLLTGNNYADRLLIAREAIIKSISNLSLESVAAPTGVEPSVNDKMNLALRTGNMITLEFGAENVFDGRSSFRFTTQESNLSAALTGEFSSQVQREGIANAVNQIDRVINSFYRTDIEGAYDRLEKNNLLAYVIDKQYAGGRGQLTGNAAMSRYREIEQIKSELQLSRSDIRMVKDYAQELELTRKSVEDIFASQNEYKQLINGIVTQMKDVQVPDLLSAIHRLHSFNAKFR